MSRHDRRKHRACLHLCSKLESVGAGAHVPRRIHGAWRPFPSGAQSRLDNHTKNTTAPLATRTVLQTLTARGTGEHTKRKRTIRYSRFYHIKS